MGLAASQARLLTITARLADNELRSQTINNAKMRLATQSAQASNEYVSALNNAQLMFTNTNENGLSQTQPLTFNTLTQYSQYNNQYGLVNAAGQALVSEKDAKIFEANKTNLEGFLKAHGLEWETTYFDETSGDLTSKLQSFYSGDYKYIGDLFEGMDNEDLKNLYLDAISEESSIEALNYTKSAKDCYNEIVSLKSSLFTELRNELFDSSVAGINEEELINSIAKLGSAQNVKNELIRGNESSYDGLILNSIDGGAKFSINYLLTGFSTKIIDDTVLTKLKSQLASLIDIGGMAGSTVSTTEMPEGHTAGRGHYYTSSAGDKAAYDLGTTYNFSLSYTIDDSTGTKTTKTVNFTIVYNQEIWENDEGVTYTDSEGHVHQCKKKTGVKSYIYCDDPNFTYNGNKLDSATAQATNSGAGNLSGIPGFYNESQINAVFHDINGPNNLMLHYYNINSDLGPEDAKYYVSLNAMSNDPEAIYKIVAKEYLKAILDNDAAFDYLAYAEHLDNNGSSSPALKSLKEAMENFEKYGINIKYPEQASLLLDFEALVKSYKFDDGSGINPSNPKINEYFKSVLGVYMVEKMVDVLGEPKYAWIDKSTNPADNPDSKAQWLSNLFNRMQKGYKVLENGLANSKEWLEYAFESGLVSMEQVDLSYNWVSLDYKSCANINEDTDNSALVAKAEAKYNRAMNDIKQKDSLYDLQLKNIDTEHSSLQTEYDVIKGVINKNIERTMKFDQNA